MSPEVIAALIGVIGVIFGIIPTYFFTRQKGVAEVEKIKAEADNLRAQTAKIESELAQLAEARKLMQFSKELQVMQKKEFDSLQQILREYVMREGGLDFVAFIYKGKVRYEVFEEQLRWRLNHFLIGRDVQEQVEYYLQLAKDIRSIIDIANDRLDELKHGVLFRTIFDVKQGGFFYYHLTDSSYVVGAAVDQKVMDDNSGDLEFRSMISAIERFMAKADI